MTEPHERIWAFEPDIFDNCSIWQDVPSPKNDATEYIRADHVDALLKQARDDALREAAEIAAETANWVPHKSDDFRKAILDLISEDKTDG